MGLQELLPCLVGTLRQHISSWLRAALWDLQNCRPCTGRVQLAALTRQARLSHEFYLLRLANRCCATEMVQSA